MQELVQECFPKHSRMGTARMIQDKETDEEGKNEREALVWKEQKRARKMEPRLLITT